MAFRFLRLKRLAGAPSSLLLHSSRLALPSLPRYSPKYTLLPKLNSPASCNLWIISRDLSSGSVNLVISDGKPKFEIQERDPPKKHKWKTKKRLKMQRKREKTKRKEANKRDPRCIRPKGQKKKQKFPTAEARIKYKIEKAKLKEALLVEKLKKYEVPQAQGPNPKEDPLLSFSLPRSRTKRRKPSLGFLSQSIDETAALLSSRRRLHWSTGVVDPLLPEEARRLLPVMFRRKASPPVVV